MAVGNEDVLAIKQLHDQGLGIAEIASVQWVATGGWLDLTGQGFLAEIAGIY